jgi:hypothetical protein
VAIESIRELPERPLQYEALLPIDDAAEGAEIGSSPAFEVQVLRGHQIIHGSAMMGLAPRAGVVSSLVANDDSADLDLTLLSPGLPETVLRVSSEVANYVSPDDIVLQPVVLGEAGWFRFKRVKIEFIPDPMVEPWDFPVFLPLARVHRPEFKDCVTTYSVSESNTKTYEADFNFGGLGAGASVAFTSTLKRTYSASATCKEVRVPARASIVYGTTMMNGQPVSDGTRVHIYGVENKIGYADIKPELDQCGWEVSRIPDQELTEANLSGATGGKDDSMQDDMTVGRQGSGKVSLGVDLGKIPFKISTTYSRDCAYEVDVSTTFMPGADYIGYHPQLVNLQEKCWSVIH